MQSLTSTFLPTENTPELHQNPPTTMLLPGPTERKNITASQHACMNACNLNRSSLSSSDVFPASTFLSLSQLLQSQSAGHSPSSAARRFRTPLFLLHMALLSSPSFGRINVHVCGHMSTRAYLPTYAPVWCMYEGLVVRVYDCFRMYVCAFV